MKRFGTGCYRVCSAGRRLTHPLKSVRNIQTASTVHHKSLHEALSLALKEASAPHHGYTSNDMPSHILILVSRHYFPCNIKDLPSFLHKSVTDAIGDDTIQVAGGIVDEVLIKGLSGTPGVSILIASEDEKAAIHVFEDPTDRTISVGRAWKSQASQEKPFDEANWTPSGDLKNLFSGTTSSPQHRSITAQDHVRDAIILAKGDFSALDWPRQLFRRARLYGLLPSATPFLTGLPMTLTFNSKLVTGGGIAMAFRDRHAKCQIKHPQLAELGDLITITKSQGNILITLDGQPATHALLDRIKTVLQKDLKISKDILLFAQIHHQGVDNSEQDALPVVKIIAGDPGKGSMALNNGYRVREGDSLRLFYQRNTLDEQVAAQKHEFHIHPHIRLTKINADTGEEYEAQMTRDTSQETSVVENLFTGASCAGLIIGCAGEESRTFVAEPVGSTIDVE